MFFILIFLLSSVRSDGYNCAGNWTLSPPADLSQPYYYPENWNETMPAAQYNASQFCLWKVLVPQEMYATVTFYKFSNSLDSGIDFIYPNLNVNWVQDNDTSPVIFTSPLFWIRLNVSDTQGLFSFKVVWSNYTSNLCQANINLDSTDISPSFQTNCLVTYTTPNQVRLSTFFNSQETQIRILRHSAIYEGNSINGTFLGTLYDAAAGGIVSNGKSLTCYTFGLQVNYTLFLVMDINAAPDIMYFNTPNCYPTGLCNIDLFSAGADNYATVTTSRDIDYVGSSSFFPYNTSISIYEGKMTSDRLLATLDQSDYYNKLPMAVKSYLKIYRIDTGRYSLRLYNTPEKVGRQVNIHSFDYRQDSTAQYTSESFSTGPNGGLMNFNFNVKYFDVVGNTKLEVTVFQNGSVVNCFRFFKENPPPMASFSALGDAVIVEYQPYGYFTKGFEVDMLYEKYEDTTAAIPKTTKTTARSSTATTTKPTTTTSKQPSTSTTMKASTSSPSLSSLSTLATSTTKQLSSTEIIVPTTTSFETTTKSTASIFNHKNVSIILIMTLMKLIS